MAHPRPKYRPGRRLTSTLQPALAVSLRSHDTNCLTVLDGLVAASECAPSAVVDVCNAVSTEGFDVGLRRTLLANHVHSGRLIDHVLDSRPSSVCQSRGIVSAEPTRSGRLATLLPCSSTLSSVVSSNGWLLKRTTRGPSRPGSDLKAQLNTCSRARCVKSIHLYDTVSYTEAVFSPDGDNNSTLVTIKVWLSSILLYSPNLTRASRSDVHEMSVLSPSPNSSRPRAQKLSRH